MARTNEKLSNSCSPIQLHRSGGKFRSPARFFASGCIEPKAARRKPNNFLYFRIQNARRNGKRRFGAAGSNTLETPSCVKTTRFPTSLPAARLNRSGHCGLCRTIGAISSYQAYLKSRGMPWRGLSWLCLHICVSSTRR